MIHNYLSIGYKTLDEVYFANITVIPLPKKLFTIFTLSPLSPKLTNSENVRFVLFFGIKVLIKKI